MPDLRDLGGGGLRGKLLGLGVGPLALADAVDARQRGLARRQLASHVIRACMQVATLATGSADATFVPVRHAGAPAPVAREAVEGDPPRRAQVELCAACRGKVVRGRQAPGPVLPGRHAGAGAAVPAGLLRAPEQRLLVGARDAGVAPAREEALPRETHEPLDLASREGMPGLARARREPYALHERLILAIPDGPALGVATGSDAGHVVGENELGDAEDHEGAEHPDKQVLLPRIGEEVDVGHAAMVAYHAEAGDSALGTVGTAGGGKPPARLVRLAGGTPGPLPAAALGPGRPPLGGTRSLWRETCTSAVAGPPAWPWETSLSNTTCELAGPFPGWSSTKPAWPPGTVVAGLRPQSPRGPAPDPLRLVVLALWRAGPVLRQNSARLMCPRSSGRPASRAMPSRASSMILCRSSRPSLISFVLLTPAHRHDASVGTNGGRDDSAPRVDG